MLRELKLEQYIAPFEEEEMASITLLEEIVGRSEGRTEHYSEAEPSSEPKTNPRPQTWMLMTTPTRP